MTYDEAQAKAKNNPGPAYNEAQSRKMRDEVLGNTFETRSGKMVEVVGHTDHNNIIVKANDEHDAVSGVWFITHVERGSFERN